MYGTVTYGTHLYGEGNAPVTETAGRTLSWEQPDRTLPWGGPHHRTLEL